MRGAILYAPGDIRVEDRDDPRIEKPTDAIIKLSATCVCGSDLWPYRGIEAVRGPASMGHEYPGIVEEAGSDVRTIKPGQFEQLPARQGWPRGATYDDTALTLLVAGHLADRDGDCDPDAFLADLAEQASAIRGLGPTTTAAIEHFHRGGEPAAAPARTTNGAAMRALPIGWVLPHDQAERRRKVTITMSRATHADPTALVAACVIAACASWALEGASPHLLLAVAAGEACEAEGRRDRPGRSGTYSRSREV
jgi:ADP-ribosylglycohydrolase